MSYVTYHPHLMPARRLPKITAWAADFNTTRPRSALGYLTPAVYAANYTATDNRLRKLTLPPILIQF